MPESPEIERIRMAEQHNYRISRDALGDTTELADDCVQLYDSLPKLLTAVSSEASDHEFAAHIGALTFYGACRYQLTMSVLAVLRGHATDAMVFLRRAIELCAFGALVKRHPHKALVWLDAGTGDKAYKIYQEKFGTKSLFPSGDSVLTALWKRYDFCSKMMHGSICSVSRHIKEEGKEDYYNYFDIEGPEDPNLVASFFGATGYLVEAGARSSPPQWK
jgi:hypothetical protein